MIVTMALDDRLLARAAALRALDLEVTRAAGTPERAALAGRYVIDHRDLTAPYDAMLEALRRRDTSDLDLAMTFLETRPDFLGSGYLTSRIIRALAKLEPEMLDRPRLDAVLARIAAEPRSEEQRAAASLIERLAAGSPRRAPRVLEPKDRKASSPIPSASEEPYVFKVKGRAI
jgi:hypothetical protein